MSAVENLALRVDMTELNIVLMVVKSAVAVLLSPGKSIRLLPTVRRERWVSCFFLFNVAYEIAIRHSLAFFD